MSGLEVVMTAIPAPGWFTAALESLRAGDVDGYMQMYDDDAVHEFPFAPEGRLERLEGKPAIAEYMKNLPAAVQFDSFDDVRVREAGDELIVEAQRPRQAPRQRCAVPHAVRLVHHPQERPRLTLPGPHEPAATPVGVSSCALHFRAITGHPPGPGAPG
jgi:hypothetical protein